VGLIHQKSKKVQPTETFILSKLIKIKENQNILINCLITCFGQMEMPLFVLDCSLCDGYFKLFKQTKPPLQAALQPKPMKSEANRRFLS